MSSRSRASSVPPIGNVFWSSPTQAEWQLRASRPRELPPVPGADEEVRQELEQPLTDEQAAHGKRPREFGRAGALGAEFSTPASWQGMDQGKEEATSGMKDHELGKAQRSAGMMPMESPEKGDQTEGPHPGGDDEVVDSFQRALEREMLEKLREDNRQLQSELQDLKMQREMEVNSGVASSWSDVSSRPQPPPPPREEEEPQRFTPNGTRIPKAHHRTWMTEFLVGLWDPMRRVQWIEYGSTWVLWQFQLVISRDYMTEELDTGLVPDMFEIMVIVVKDAGRDPDMNKANMIAETEKKFLEKM